MSVLYTVLVAGGAAAANILFAAMFAARVVAPARASAIGMAGTAMAIPLLAASVLAAVDGSGPWAVALPLVFVAFAVGEDLVDAVLRLDFRGTRWLWPYLAAFYVAQWAVIGAAFLASRLAGFAVLASYFLCLAATAWSYRRVGHGRPASPR